MSAPREQLALDDRPAAAEDRRLPGREPEPGGRRVERPSRFAHDDRDRRQLSVEHPSPTAPLAEWIGRTRFVVLIAVVGVVLVSVALFVIGAGMAVQGIWHAMLAAIRGELTATSITVDLLEVVSVMLKAVVFYLIGVGFYSLFIAPLNLTAALGIRSFNDLEIKVVSVVVVIMAVTFLEHFIRWDQAVETLLYGVSLGIVVAALVFFQMHSHREAREDEHENAMTRIRAQREMFHADHEEREVRPDEALEQSQKPRVERQERRAES